MSSIIASNKMIFIMPAEECGCLALGRENRPIFDESDVFQHEITITFRDNNGGAEFKYKKGLHPKCDYVNFYRPIQSETELKWRIFKALYVLNPVITELENKCFKSDSQRKERIIALRDCIYDLAMKTARVTPMEWGEKYPEEKRIWMEGIEEFEIKWLGKKRRITSNYIFRTIKYHVNKFLSWIF